MILAGIKSDDMRQEKPGEKPVQLIEHMIKEFTKIKNKYEDAGEKEEIFGDICETLKKYGVREEDRVKYGNDPDFNKFIKHCAKQEKVDEIIKCLEGAVKIIEENNAKIAAFEDNDPSYADIWETVKKTIDDKTREFGHMGIIKMLYDTDKIRKETQIILEEQGLLSKNAINTKDIKDIVKIKSEPYETKYESFEDYYGAHETHFKNGNYSQFAIGLHKYIQLVAREELLGTTHKGFQLLPLTPSGDGLADKSLKKKGPFTSKICSQIWRDTKTFT